MLVIMVNFERLNLRYVIDQHAFHPFTKVPKWPRIEDLATILCNDYKAGFTCETQYPCLAYLHLAVVTSSWEWAGFSIFKGEKPWLYGWIIKTIEKVFYKLNIFLFFVFIRQKWWCNKTDKPVVIDAHKTLYPVLWCVRKCFPPKILMNGICSIIKSFF